MSLYDPYIGQPSSPDPGGTVSPPGLVRQPRVIRRDSFAMTAFGHRVSPRPCCGCQRTAEIIMTWQDKSPPGCCAALATVKAAGRRLRR